LRNYQKSWLRFDVLAGLSVAAIAIPESLGYAVIVGLPPETGLYCAVLPAIVFAFIGSTRRLVVGADSATAAMVAAGASAIAVQGDSNHVAAIGALGLLTAVVLLVMSMARLGFLANLISRPVLVGMLGGIGISLMITKSSVMLGYSTSGSMSHRLLATFTHLYETNLWTAAVSILAVVLMLGLSRFVPRAPAALIALTVATGVATLIGTQAHGIEVVGSVPAGLPGLSLPLVSLGEFTLLVPAALAISLVILAQSAPVAKFYARQHQEEHDENLDLLGFSLANAASAVTGGFAVNGSPPRSAAAEDAGGSTPVVNLVMAATIALVLIGFTGLFDYIPEGVLAGIVFAVGVGLIRTGELKQISRQRRSEFTVAMVALIAVGFIGVQIGVFVAVTVSLVDRLRRQYHPVDQVLLDEHQIDPIVAARLGVTHVDGAIVYRFGGSILFDNADWFAERVRELLKQAVTPVTLFVVDCRAVEDIDFTASGVLEELCLDVSSQGAHFVLTEVSPEVQELLTEYDLSRHLHFTDDIEIAFAQFGPGGSQR
jgi:anti-anti-sigma factor